MLPGKNLEIHHHFFHQSKSLIITGQIELTEDVEVIMVGDLVAFKDTVEENLHKITVKIGSTDIPPNLEMKRNVLFSENRDFCQQTTRQKKEEEHVRRSINMSEAYQ